MTRYEADEKAREKKMGKKSLMETRNISFSDHLYRIFVV